ncbi:MAG: DUF4397 domain-containing protein [Acidimicrobiales bacterium]|nr:DUF4397 domain-containing protein [Acidimicrobiales bacterium]
MRKLTAAAAALAAAAFLATGAPAGAQDGNGTVTVIHAIPDTPVDVYVNGDLTLDDFAPGTVTDPLSLPAGDYDLALTAPDAADASSPILEATATVEAGGIYTIVAHLSEAGDPTITPFVNDTTKTKAGEGGVVVRHTAAAPTVDILVGGDPVVEGLSNPDSAGPLYLPAGTISAAVAPAGTTDPVIGPADVPVEEGKVTIVYAWGSLEAENLAVAVQQIEVGVEAAEETPTTTAPPAGEPESAPVPNRVDTGDSGLATDATGPSAALLTGIAVLALAAGATGAVSLARSRSSR